MSSPIIISLDGNIGAGKSTLLARIRESIPEMNVIPEPVDTWTSLKMGDSGKNLLELFYEDKKRWAYTFQNCAILTRLQNIEQAIAHPDVKSNIFLTERSVLTDRYVFAEMLYESGDINDIEWQLYNKWFDTFAKRLPIKGIIYLTTSPETSQKRIKIRNRHGEENIHTDYLDALDNQHHKWISNTEIPVLQISTEEGVDMNNTIAQIKGFIATLSGN